MNRAKPYTGPIPASCNEYSGNRKIGCALMLDRRLQDFDQFPCLDKLWNQESGWNHKAYNSSSGAYGIPQALPGSKMERRVATGRPTPPPRSSGASATSRAATTIRAMRGRTREDAGWY